MLNLISFFTMTIYLLLPVSALSMSKITAEQVKYSAVDSYYVGADGSCDYSNIAAAIDASSGSPNQVSVLIAYNKTYKENLVLNHNNIQLDGNYENCELARRGVLGRNTSHIISNVSADPIMHIRGESATLKNITIRDHAEGGILATRNSSINLENMTFNSLGSTGFSAIKLQASAQVQLHINNSSFSFNTSDQGGAIYCNGKNSSIDIQNTVFLENQASDYGGAVFVTGCDFSVYDSSFQNNRADFGGGVYLLSSDVVLNKTNFIANTANFSSGALVASHSTINAEAVRFIDNQATTSLGGAIGLVNSTLNLTKNNANCADEIKCNYFSNNKAGFAGGAIGSESGVINIAGTYFENNRADYGTVLYLTVSNLTNIEGSVFVDNGNEGDSIFLDQNVVFIEDDTVARISYSTFADNNTVLSTFYHKDNSQLSVYSSIIYDPGNPNVFDIEDIATLDVNCLIVHETLSFDSFNNHVIIADPMFVDPANGDYHINAATSPAVDYCTDSIAMAEYQDIDNQDRGYDDPNTPNNPTTNGTYDIGADEVTDLIFTDGFE